MEDDDEHDGQAEKYVLLRRRSNPCGLSSLDAGRIIHLYTRHPQEQRHLNRFSLTIFHIVKNSSRSYCLLGGLLVDPAIMRLDQVNQGVARLFVGNAFLH